MLNVSHFAQGKPPLVTHEELFDSVAEAGKQTQDFCHLVQEHIDGLVRNRDQTITTSSCVYPLVSEWMERLLLKL